MVTGGLPLSLRREGFEVNAKRVARIRREEGFKVSKRQRRIRRLGLSTAERQPAERARQVWSWDFIEDQTENGSRFRILTLIDKRTRESLAIHAGWSIRAVDVIMVLEPPMPVTELRSSWAATTGPSLSPTASKTG